MRRFTLAELAALAGGRLLGDDATVTGAAIDSRAVAAGDLFAALPGSRVDGHGFLAAAREAGAAELCPGAGVRAKGQARRGR